MGRRDRKRKADAEQAETRAIIESVAAKAPKQASYGVFAADEWKTSIQEVHMRSEAVTWAFPMDEHCWTRWIENLLVHQRIMPWDNVVFTRNTYLPQARNMIHSAFVTEHKTKLLIMLDSDVIPPPNYLTRILFDMRVDPTIKMIGGWYKRKTGAQDPVVYDHMGGISYAQRKVKGEGVESVDAAGAGCWVMSREVATAIGETPYNMNEGGEDMLLCRKVHAAGYLTWIDWDIECAHVGVGVY